MRSTRTFDWNCQNGQCDVEAIESAISKPNASFEGKPIHVPSKRLKRAEELSPITDSAARQKVDAIFAKSYCDLLGYAKWLLHGNVHKAEEVIQELALILCKRIGSLCQSSDGKLWEFVNDEEFVRKWMFGTTRILAIRTYRQSARSDKQKANLKIKLLKEQSSPFQQQLLVGEVRILLEECLPDEQKAVQLRAEGLPQDEIARLLGLRSRFVVCRLLAIAKKRIKTRLGYDPVRR